MEKDSTNLTNNKLPLVSVMMPTYNSAPFIEQSVRSVLRQSYNNIEVVIVDDGSTDETPHILERLAMQDSRIKLILSSHRGRGIARNCCLEKCTGEFIAVCDSDDVSFPDRFRIQVDYMIANPGIDVLGAGYVAFEGRSPEEWSQRVYVETTPHQIGRSFARGRMRVSNAAAMIRHSSINKIGRYNENLQRAQDYELFARLHLIGGKFAAIKEPLIFYRQNRRIPNMAYFVENGLYMIYAKKLLKGFNFGFKDYCESLFGQMMVCYFRLKYIYFYTKYKFMFKKHNIATEYLHHWIKSSA